VKPYFYVGKVVFIHTAVEFDCIIDYGFRHFVRQRLWLNNAEAPLFRSDSQEDKIAARKAKQCAMKLLLNRRVLFRTHLGSSGKYDKYSADIFIMNTPTKCTWSTLSHEGVEYIDAAKYMSMMRDQGYNPDKVDVDTLYNG